MTDKFISDYTNQTSPASTAKILIDEGTGNYKYMTLANMALNMPVISATSTTNTTSGSTGSIYTAGGLGVTKDIYAGGKIILKGYIQTPTSAAYAIDINSADLGNGEIRCGSTTDSYGTLRIRSASSECLFGHESSAGGNLGTGSTGNATLINTGGNYPLEIYTNNAKRLKIAGDGTAEFSGEVDCLSTSGFQAKNVGNSVTGVFSAQASTVDFGTTTAHPLVMYYNSGEKIRIDGTGIKVTSLPTSNPGAGYLWNDGGTIKIGS